MREKEIKEKGKCKIHGYWENYTETGICPVCEYNKMKKQKKIINKDMDKMHKIKIGLANKGKIRSPEFRKKVSQSMMGIKRSKETREKMSKSKRGCFIGIKSYAWKGKGVSYSGLHKWVNRFLGKVKKCELCGKKINNPRSVHWANINHKYNRNLVDWIGLCVKCHSKYDKFYN
jgi:hypothetical protein